MTARARRILWGACACLAGLLGLASPASAQLFVDAYRSPYWGYSYSPYWALEGVASVIRAEGDYLVKVQEAKIKREEARREALQTYKAKLETWAWERDFRHTEWKKERERQKESNRLVAYDSITPSAGILNLLFDDLKNNLAALDSATPVPLPDPETIPHINFTVLGGGNVGLLKKDHLPWSLVLLDSAFVKDRERIEELLSQAKSSARQEKIDPAALQELRARVKSLVGELEKQNRADKITPDDYVESKRLLDGIRAGMVVLRHPEQAAFLLSEARECKTIPDLIRYMMDKGLRFSDATEGVERYYYMLHSALIEQSKRIHPER